MKVIRWFGAIGLIALLSYPIVSFAEGRCPPGQYPIGSNQGVLGCAPIPGAQTGQENASVNDAPLLPPQPTGRWHSRFGAMLQSKSTSVVGLAADGESAEDAMAEAQRMCGSDGAKDCQVLLTYSNQCAAWVVPSAAGAGVSGYAVGKTVRQAEKNAQKYCKDATGKKCKTFYSACSKPVFEKF